MSASVTSYYPCPKCDNEEAFESYVRLGDYSELRNTVCKSCFYALSETEEQEITDRAWEDAPERYADERAEWGR